MVLPDRGRILMPAVRPRCARLVAAEYFQDDVSIDCVGRLIAIDHGTIEIVGVVDEDDELTVHRAALGCEP